MSFTFNTSGGDGASGAANTIAKTLSGINVGDHIFIGITHEGLSATGTLSDGTSSFTLSAAGWTHHGSGEPHLGSYYLLSSVASGSVTYTFTFDGGATRVFRNIEVMVWSPSAAASLEGTAVGASGTGTAVSSGNITVAGADLLVYGSYAEYGKTAGTPLINGVSTGQHFQDAVVFRGAVWAQPFSSGFTNAASATLSASERWCEQVVGFKISSGGTSLDAGNQSVTITAPSVTLTSGPSSVTAGNQSVIITAPSAIVTSGVSNLTAGNNQATITAPTAVLSAILNLLAGNNSVTVTSPAASVVSGVSLVNAGNNTAVFTAPTATITGGSPPIGGFWAGNSGMSGLTGGGDVDMLDEGL